MCWTGLSGISMQVFAKELLAENKTRNPAIPCASGDRVESMKRPDSRRAVLILPTPDGGRGHSGKQPIKPPPAIRARSKRDRRSRFHGGRAAGGLVDASEVVPGVPKDHCCPVVSHFFEKPFVSLVNLRSPMRRLRLLRSTMDVQIRSGSGCPMIGTTCVDATSAGE